MKNILILAAIASLAACTAEAPTPEVEAVETVEVPATDEAVEEEPVMEPINPNEENVKPK